MPPRAAKAREWKTKSAAFVCGQPKRDIEYLIWTRLDNKKDMPPSNAEGAVGDLFQDHESQKIWVRYKDEWAPAGRVNGGTGCQFHPQYEAISLWTVDVLRWASHQGMKNKKKDFVLPLSDDAGRGPLPPSKKRASKSKSVPVRKSTRRSKTQDATSTRQDESYSESAESSEAEAAPKVARPVKTKRGSKVADVGKGKQRAPVPTDDEPGSPVEVKKTPKTTRETRSSSAQRSRSQQIADYQGSLVDVLDGFESESPPGSPSGPAVSGPGPSTTGRISGGSLSASAVIQEQSPFQGAPPAPTKPSSGTAALSRKGDQALQLPQAHTTSSAPKQPVQLVIELDGEPYQKLNPKLAARAERAENGWLVQAFQDWRSVGSIHTAGGRFGYEMLKAAMARPSRILSHPTYQREEFTVRHNPRPTLAMLLHDMIAVPGDVNVAVRDGFTGNRVSRESVFAGLMYHGTGYDRKALVPSSAPTDIPATRQGLAKCLMTIPVDLLSAANGRAWPQDPTENVVTSTLSVPGSCSIWYTESVTSSHAVVPLDMPHEDGVYLIWFLAPPTPSNLELMKRYWLETPPPTDFYVKVMRSIDELHYVVQQGNGAQGFIVPAGWIRSVMTLRVSGHAEFDFILPQHLEDMRASVNWQMKHLSNLPVCSRRHSIIAGIRDTLEMWTSVPQDDDWSDTCSALLDSWEPDPQGSPEGEDEEPESGGAEEEPAHAGVEGSLPAPVQDGAVMTAEHASQAEPNDNDQSAALPLTPVAVTEEVEEVGEDTMTQGGAVMSQELGEPRVRRQTVGADAEAQSASAAVEGHQPETGGLSLSQVTVSSVQAEPTEPQMMGPTVQHAGSGGSVTVEPDVTVEAGALLPLVSLEAFIEQLNLPPAPLHDDTEVAASEAAEQETEQ